MCLVMHCRTYHDGVIEETGASLLGHQCLGMSVNACIVLTAAGMARHGYLVAIVSLDMQAITIINMRTRRAVLRLDTVRNARISHHC